VLPRDQCQPATATWLASPQVVVFPTDVDSRSCLAVLGALRPGISLVIADMSATETCDPAAIRDLILANNHATCTGAELRVVSPSSAVLRSLQAVGADQMLRLYPDMASAMAEASQAEVMAGTVRLSEVSRP
jgi:anti-anti-sigma regulatory factor